MADYAIHDTTLSGIANVIRKKDGTSALIDPADYEDRIDLMGMLEEKTVSGSVVAFSDGADAVPLKSCAVTIAPTLDGVSSVDVVKAGKNLVNIPDSVEITRNQLISTVVPLLDDFLNGKKGNYTISAKTAETVENANFITIRINYTDGTSSSNVYIYRGSTHESGGITGTFSISSDPAKIIDSVSFGGNTGTAKCAVSEWQIEANATATAYTPYVQPTTHTANLGRTIYGGEVDVVNGTGTDEWCEPLTFTGASSENWSWGQSGGYYRANITVQNIAYTVGSRSECFCNLGTYKASGNDYNACFIYGNPTSAQFFFYPPQGIESLADFKTWLSSNNLKMTAPKATPEDFIFTPVPIISRLGDNTLWGDGDLSVVYRSSGTQTIITPTLISKTITENGTYSAEDDNADGYDEVTVNVPTGTTEPFKVLSINGTAGSETFTADKAGTYMFLVGTSAQGTASITSSVTPDLTFSKQSSDNRGLVGAIYTLAVADTVTMSNSVVSWVYNTKVVVEMNISVSAVIDSTIVNDGTITSFSPSVTGNALFISMAGGRSADNSYDRTYTNLNDFEFFGKVETGIFLRIRYGSTVPSYQLYGYDGGCALAIALSVNAPSLLMGGLVSSNSEEENTNSEEEESESESD